MKRERWGIIASICICLLVAGAVLVLAGFTGGGHFSPDDLKKYIDQVYSAQPPVPNTPADQRYEAGSPDPGYDREAVLDAKIAALQKMYESGSMGSSTNEIINNISKQEFALASNNDIIAMVDGTPVKKSAVEIEKLYQKASFLNGEIQYNSADFATYKNDPASRLSFKEQWTQTETEADIVFNAVERTMAVNEAQKLGVAMSMEDARTAVQQDLPNIIGSITGQTDVNADAISTYIQSLGLTMDQFVDYYAKQKMESNTIQNLVDHFKSVLPQDVQQDQNKLSDAWTAYIDALVRKATIRLI